MLNIHKINEILKQMNISATRISPFKVLEDDSDYDVFLIETNMNKFVVKPTKNYEFEIYSTFFKDNISGVPNLITSTEYGNEKFILIEYIEGKERWPCQIRLSISHFQHFHQFIMPRIVCKNFSYLCCKFML